MGHVFGPNSGFWFGGQAKEAASAQEVKPLTPMIGLDSREMNGSSAWPLLEKSGGTPSTGPERLQVKPMNEAVRHIEMQLEDVFEYMRADSLLGGRRVSWKLALPQTLSHLSTLQTVDPAAFQKCQENLFILTVAMSKWQELMQSRISMQTRNLLYNAGRAIQGPALSTVDPPVILSSLDTWTIPVPFGLKTDYVVTCRYKPGAVLADCFGVAHELGHVLMILYLGVVGVEHFTETIVKPIWDKGYSIGLETETIALAIDPWIVHWVSELLADAFAVISWGPGVALNWIRDTRSQPHKSVGDSEYPPHHMRTEWMIERIMEFSAQLDAGTARLLKKLKSNCHYKMDCGFYAGAGVGLCKRRRLNSLIYHPYLARSVRNRIDDALGWDQIGRNPLDTRAAVSASQEDHTKGLPARLKLAAILEIDGTKFFAGERTGRMDHLAL